MNITRICISYTPARQAQNFGKKNSDELSRLRKEREEKEAEIKKRWKLYYEISDEYAKRGLLYQIEDIEREIGAIDVYINRELARYK